MSDVRLIDANDLKRDFAELCAMECPICSFYIPNADVSDCHCGLIDNAPAVEQPTGKWIDNQDNIGGGINCSICGKILPCTDEYWYETDYCPNCGAKMKGEEE